MTRPDILLDVVTSSSELLDSMTRDACIVVIDVLRATTVIGHALAAGALEVIPAGSVEEALKMRGPSGPGAPLVCGERGGFKVPGFDLGNSPLEYRPETVGGRTVVLASTNGSVIMARCRTARRVFAASFNTLSAVAGRIRAEGGAWTVICSGKLGRPCLEDLACAGALSRLLGIDLREAAGREPSDTAADGLTIALSVDQIFGNDVLPALRTSAHGRYLESIGFDRDLEVCAAIDSLDIAPELIEGRIRIG